MAPGLASLADLLAHLKIAEWDALIVGDGSGTGWKMGAGWAAVLIDKYSGARKLFYGAMNTGTVTLGELFPYLHALSWYTGRDGPGRHRRRELQAVNRQMKIHIVTDSQIIATCGNNRVTAIASGTVGGFRRVPQAGLRLGLSLHRTRSCQSERPCGRSFETGKT